MVENTAQFYAVASILCIFAFASFLLLIKKNQLKKQIQIRTDKLAKTTVVALVEENQKEIDVINQKLHAGQLHYDNLSNELQAVEKSVDRIKVGLLPPVFRHDDRESLQEKIEAEREKQYVLIKEGGAADANSDWSLFGDKKKGKKMCEAYKLLLLRAYNAEFDFIRKQMRHSSLDTAINKLRRLEEQLEKLGETVNVNISYSYADLKEAELRIWHNELVHKEELKQERKRQQALIREQNKNNAADDTDDIEEEIQEREAMIAKAKKLALEKSGEGKAALELQIKGILDEIAQLNKIFERVKSQAQITRAGYIYVISNIGSFGKGIVKIGMTRRLEPMDRVNELGDASVPYKFDVHTLAFVDDAPTIEKQLHEIFHASRVNTEIQRKEFFRVPVKEVQKAMENMSVESDWYYDAEAKEYRESVLIRESLEKQKVEQSDIADSFPASI